MKSCVDVLWEAKQTEEGEEAVGIKGWWFIKVEVAPLFFLTVIVFSFFLDRFFGRKHVFFLLFLLFLVVFLVGSVFSCFLTILFSFINSHLRHVALCIALDSLLTPLALSFSLFFPRLRISTQLFCCAASASTSFPEGGWASQTWA